MGKPTITIYGSWFESFRIDADELPVTESEIIGWQDLVISRARAALDALSSKPVPAPKDESDTGAEPPPATPGVPG